MKSFKWTIWWNNFTFFQTALSIAKLASLASDESEESISSRVDEIEHHLTIVGAQEQLPKIALEEYGFDLESMRVLTPREIIELYIGKENLQADQIDFKKALDLLDYLGSDAELKDDLRLHIWWDFERGYSHDLIAMATF